MAAIERPQPALQALLRENGYTYLCDHGGGDQMWLHEALPGFEGVEAKYAGRGQCRGEGAVEWKGEGG